MKEVITKLDQIIYMLESIDKDNKLFFMDKKESFFELYKEQKQKVNKSKVALKYGVDRKTIYNWINEFNEMNND